MDNVQVMSVLLGIEQWRRRGRFQLLMHGSFSFSLTGMPCPMGSVTPQGYGP